MSPFSFFLSFFSGSKNRSLAAVFVILLKKYFWQNGKSEKSSQT